MHHLQAHTHGWMLTLDPTTGTLTGHRHHRRRWSTHPPATPLAHPTTNRQRHTDSRDPPTPTTDQPTNRHDPPDSRDPPDDNPHTDHHGNPLPF